MLHSPNPPAADFEALRERLNRSGAEGLDTAECLGFALRRGAGRAALGWAERLLFEFGSLPDLLGAPRADLVRTATPAIARDLEVLHELQLRALRAPLRILPVLSDRPAVADYLQVLLAAERREQLWVLFLDKALRLVRDERMGVGTVDHVPIYPREILRRALETGASEIILAHNHPAGLLQPSAADIEATRQLVTAGHVLRVAVHDHLLVAGRAVLSFRAQGLL
jgi:DNA repair protein RadC